MNKRRPRPAQPEPPWAKPFELGLPNLRVPDGLDDAFELQLHDVGCGHRLGSGGQNLGPGGTAITCFLALNVLLPSSAS